MKELFAGIREKNPAINAFTSVVQDRKSRNPSGPLAGVPFAVKNLFDVKGLSTLAGSKINRERPPAGEDAFLIKNSRTRARSWSAR